MLRYLKEGHHVYKYVPIIRRIGVSMCLRHFMQKLLHIPPYHVSNFVEVWLNTKQSNLSPNRGQSILILKELSPKQFSPACMAFPLRLLFPHNYHRFHVQEQCLHHMLQTVQKPTKSWEGSRLSNKASDQIRWLPITSIDAPQISARIHPLSHNFPETLRIAPPTRPSFHSRQSGSGRGQDVWGIC